MNYCILETKADNEPAISLPVHEKNEICFTKKKRTKKKKERKEN